MARRDRAPARGCRPTGVAALLIVGFALVLAVIAWVLLAERVGPPRSPQIALDLPEPVPRDAPRLPTPPTPPPVEPPLPRPIPG